MAGILGLFGLGARPNTPDALARGTAQRIQSSIEGRPRAIGAGQNRLAGNLVWFGDYRATALPAAAGGKGAGGTGKGQPNGYTYSASFMVSIGETIAGVQTIINGNQYDFFYTPPADLIAKLAAKGITITSGNTYGAAFLLGDYAQSPWSYLVTAHPAEALNYRGEALVCLANLGLGESPSLPNFNFEILWPLNTDVAAFGPDANPADWVSAFATNADWGAGFPAALLGDMTGYQQWARAAGLLVSPIVDSQVPAQAHLSALMQGTVAEFVWNGGLLTVVPHADSAVTGNGYTYTPDVTPLYDLGYLDFLPVNHGPAGADAPTTVKVSRTDPAQTPNQLPLEYLDRANLYNPVTLYAPNDALIVAAGRLRPADARQQHFFCAVAAASRSVSLQMRRLGILRTFYFTLPPQFIAVVPMDVLTLTEPLLRLDRQPVRVIEMAEADDGSLEFTAEEFLGTAAPPLYQRQDSSGAGRNANEDPGPANTPIIFEPEDALGNGLKVWLAVSGTNPALWGGCNVWVATDAGGTYQQVGQIFGSARMGVSTADYPDYAAAVTGQTIDSTNTLGVDMTESEGELASGSLADMTALNTASYLGGEIIAYQTATLTGANAYDLLPNVRGAYGSAIDAHPAGTPFARLDDVIFEIPFTADRVGSVMYIKLQGFNIYGGGLQDMAGLGAYAYTIQGTALASPMPDITNLRATYVDNTSGITWDEVTDFRTPRYAIRRGASWDTGLDLGTVAHPPFATYGDGRYWVKAVAEPIAGLVVYSANAVGINLAGTIIPDNVWGTYDEAGTGWTGAITGPGAIVGSNFVTTAAGSVAYYEVPDTHVFDVLYDRATRINAEWGAQGVASGSDFLGDPDFLANLDMFGSAATANIDSWVEIFVSGGDAGDVYAAPDVYDLPDVYGGSSGEWVKFAPGVQFGRRFKARIALISYDDNTQAVATAFKYSVSVPTRIDHMTNYALGSGGETFDWTPDGGSTPVPFGYGPALGNKPQVFVAIQNQQDGDYYTVTSVTLSQGTIQCFNAGVGVARTVNITVAGA